MGVVIELPWPSKELSPNARLHWAAKAKAKKVARESAFWITKGTTTWARYLPPVEAIITFNPPDNRRRDFDNFVSSAKAVIDGVADAIGVDDSKWRMTFRRGEVVKGGRVTIEINGATE